MKHLHTLILTMLLGLLVFIQNPMTVQATETDNELSQSVLSNEPSEETRTNKYDAGEAKTPEQLQELNIANNLTITYDNGNGQLSGTLRILLILTGISLAPILLMVMTSFTRILIVMHFTRQALNTTTAPPNQVLIAISIFLTFFIMQPTFTQVYNQAVIPFEEGQMETKEFLEAAMVPMREFMSKHTQVKDVDAFMQIADLEWDGKTVSDVPNSVLIPSFIISELRSAFIMGFIIYIPFIVIDMVVASVLMSMGMMMLPPTTISMPFKILLFVLADGWNLVIMNVVRTFF